MSTMLKDPSDVLDYQVEWSDWLGTDTVIASAWTVPTGITAGSASFTTTTATQWLSGGTVGETYGVTNRITTTTGRTAERTITIRVINR